jgi:hypothetical protein
MIRLSIAKLSESPALLEELRWDVTPKIFIDPSSSGGDKPVDITYGYMLYVDLMNDIPVLVIMQLRELMSKTVGYVHDVPEELLKEAMQCTESECIGGMYPIGEKLEQWLKKELDLS